MPPFIRIFFKSTGHLYEIATAVVAQDRTNYFAISDPGRTREQHVAETEMMFANDFDLFDWAKNNMNWVDLASHARLVGFTPPNFSTLWDDAELSTAASTMQPDLASLGDQGILAPIELAMSQCSAEGQSCLVVAFQNEKTKAVNSGCAVFGGAPEVVEAYIGVIVQMNERMHASQAASAAALVN